MALGAVEIAALVLSVLVVVKLVVVIFNAKTWMKIVKPLYKNPVVLGLIEIILAGVLFYYLIQQFTIVQIMSVIALGALLTGLTFTFYAKETLSWAQKLLKKKSMIKRAWLPILIWLVLVVWTLIELF